MNIRNISFFLVLAKYLTLPALLFASLALQAETVLQGNATLHYNKIASDRLSLDIRPLDNIPINQVTAQLDGIDLPVSRIADYPNEEQRTTILFLVDTSDPGRQQAVNRNIAHIRQLLDFSQPHYRYGLARFDTDLHFLTSLGVNPQAVLEKTTALKAVGKTTELYRNTLGAIKHLARYPSDRKFLFLLSDGRAEDRAYFHRDVVKAAVQNNISIFTIGYADTVSLTVALQTLRRMSEETGGQYLSSKPGTYQLDNNQLQRLFETIDLGAHFSIDLSPAIAARIGGNQDITLSITSGVSHASAVLPIKLPQMISPVPVQATIDSASTAAPVRPQVIIERVPQQIDVQPLPFEWIWILIAISLLLLVLLIYLVFQLKGRKTEHTHTVPVEEQPDDDAYAWLEIADDHSANPRRYPIRSADTKIGRYRGNDIALHDSAVSRYHAEIHFTDDGHFVIADMGSKNGLLVNDQEVLEQRLENNDIIEIGDVRLRFIIPDELADDLEDTQIFKTLIPGVKQA